MLGKGRTGAATIAAMLDLPPPQKHHDEQLMSEEGVLHEPDARFDD